MNAADNIRQPVIRFDGVCNLCSNVVQFIIRRDRQNVFRFASLQSDFGNSVLKKFHFPVDSFGSFILLKNGKIYSKSTGALLVVKELSGAWPLLSLFMVIPAFIRNSVYNIIARNRYKWFGRKQECWIPTPASENRFLD